MVEGVAVATMWITSWMTCTSFCRLVADGRIARIVSSSFALHWRKVSEVVL